MPAPPTKPNAEDERPARRARPGHGRTTLDEVAVLAGVTKITVSRYLREPQKVAGATAERIRAALADTGYVPNKQAGLLASGRSQVVAALIPNINHSIYGETLQALSLGLQGAGLELLLAATGFSAEREEEQLRTVLGWAPAALVVTGRHHSPGAARLLQQAQAAGTPVLAIWDLAAGEPAGAAPAKARASAATGKARPAARPTRSEAGGAASGILDGLATIGFDHAEVGRAMAQHLLQAGHRRLGYLDTSVLDDHRATLRAEAFADTVHAAGATLRRVTAAVGDPYDSGRAALAPLLNDAASRSRPTAVACANDPLACGLLLQAQAEGLKVPGELALLGYGDYPIARQLAPGLSTVRTPSAEIGRNAAALVVQALAGQPLPAHQRLDWLLQVRGSTQAGAPAWPGPASG